MAERRFTLMLFLIVIFVFLSAYIAVWISQIYVEKSAYAKTESSNSIKCASYAFDLKNIVYAEGLLSFDIENTMGDELKDLVIEGVSTQELIFENLFAGSIQHADISNITISGSFLAYPKGCKGANAKKYTI